MGEDPWKAQQALREHALTRGEDLARLHGFTAPPVDPFKVIASEGGQILAEGDDFRDCFDGRLSYHNGRFLLLYNTKYNRWAHPGALHPKVRFTVAHELGHYFIDAHRQFLVRRRRPIESTAEFESDREVERQADSFAVGLLMPQFLISRYVNCEPDATMETIKSTAKLFGVSLTSTMVRWTQLSDFPCATLCIRGGEIQWGFVSSAFRNCRLWRAKRKVRIASPDAKRFVEAAASSETFTEGTGFGKAHHWIEGDGSPLDVREFYAAIPHSRCVMVFVMGDERDLPALEDDEE